MTVTDETLQAAQNAIVKFDYNPYTRSGLRKILEAALSAPAGVGVETPPPQAHVGPDEAITLTPLEAWSLLYNDPKDVRSQTIMRLAVWLDGMKFTPLTTEGHGNG